MVSGCGGSLGLRTCRARAAYREENLRGLGSGCQPNDDDTGVFPKLKLWGPSNTLFLWDPQLPGIWDQGKQMRCLHDTPMSMHGFGVNTPVDQCYWCCCCPSLARVDTVIQRVSTEPLCAPHQALLGANMRLFQKDRDRSKAGCLGTVGTDRAPCKAHMSGVCRAGRMPCGLWSLGCGGHPWRMERGGGDGRRPWDTGQGDREVMLGRCPRLAVSWKVT